MDSGVLGKLGEQAPYLVALLVLVLIFLNAEEKREKTRVENAKQLEDRREKHDEEMERKRQENIREVNNMWANSFKVIMDKQEQMHTTLVQVMKEHEKNSEERYQKIGVTKDLMKAVGEKRR